MNHLSPVLRLAWLTAALPFAAPAAAGGDPLPHRRGTRAVDGDLDDWRGPALTAQWEEPEENPPLANAARAWMVWDPGYLWIAFEVDDDEVFPPPEEVSDLRLYQWDSVEIYIDTEGNRGPEMDTGDFQFIVSCDGRHAVLQGDALSRELRELGVPKRERPSLALRTAARMREHGYTVEIALPWAAIGVAEPAPGVPIAVDLTWNDWTEDHPLLPEIDLDDPAILSLIDRGDAEQVPIDDPTGIGWTARGQWLDRAYRPWSWSGTRDFGYPEQWALLELAGEPTFTEQLLRRVGGWNLALALMALTALSGGGVLAVSRWRHRRRIGLLLETLEQLERSLDGPAAPGAAPAPAGDGEDRVAGETPALATTDANLAAVTQSLDQAPDRAAATASLATKIVWALEGRSGEEDTPEGLARRALDYVRSHLDESISVAQLARVVHVSPRTLQRGLKEATRCSPREFILAVKMQEARRLLQTAGLRVSEVAYRVGFESPDHFSRRFKSYYRVPPSAISRRPLDDSDGR